MRAVAAVGFSNLTGAQNDVLQVVPRVSARIARSLQRVDHDSLPDEVSIYSYFERRPTGRQPVHLRMLSDTKELTIRLDIVVPHENATPEAVLSTFLSVWQVMQEQLSAYLARKRVPPSLRESVRNALALPPAP